MNEKDYYLTFSQKLQICRIAKAMGLCKPLRRMLIVKFNGDVAEWVRRHEKRETT